MDQKSNDEANPNLPPYSRFPQLTDTRKKWILIVPLGVLLSVIIVGATLIGIYMTQKHTEKMVTMFFKSKDGESFQQTISVNEQENVAAVYVQMNKYSGTTVYDYKRNIIGIRKPNSTMCYVLKMDESTTPSMSSILKGIEYFQLHNTPVGNTITYKFIPGEEANPIDLGINVNILCSDATIYWAKMVNSDNEKRKGGGGDDTVVVVVVIQK